MNYKKININEFNNLWDSSKGFVSNWEKKTTNLKKLIDEEGNAKLNNLAINFVKDNHYKQDGYYLMCIDFDLKRRTEKTIPNIKKLETHLKVIFQK